MSVIVYKGDKVVKTLYQYNVKTGVPTGVVKDNEVGDPDYIPPVINSPECPDKYKYGNEEQSQNFIKNNCGSGYQGSTVSYKVIEDTYFANSLNEANQLALDDINTNGQNYANANGTCTIISYPFKWIPDDATAYCEQQVEEEDYFDQLASPTIPFIKGNNLMYLDRSLNNIISFNPQTLQQTDIPFLNLNGINIDSYPSSGSPSRPIGWYYYAPNDYAYIQGDYTGGVICMRISDGTVIKHFPGGTNSQFQRGEIVYIKDLNQVWALGNSMFMKIDLTTNEVINTGMTVLGAVAVLNQNDKIYVVKDGATNSIEIYDTLTQNLIKTISNVASNVNPMGGQYTIRGFYSDETNNRLYMGEISNTPSVIIVDTNTDVISQRVSVPKEGKAYGAVQVINYNPIRERIYLGGGIYDVPNASDSEAKMWTLTNTNVIDETITPSANRNITDIIYYPPSNSVYISSRGRVPQDSPNTGHESDGVLFKFT